MLNPVVWGFVFTYNLAVMDDKTGWNVWWLVRPLWVLVGLMSLLVYWERG